MPDQPPPYRFWGHKQPEARTPVMAAADGKTAQMRIYDPIDSWGAPFGVSAKEFSDALEALPDTVDTIELHMHSPGGEVFEGLAIMNLLRQHPATVNMVVDGICASIASAVAMGADTVAMAPGAQMMIHDASGICLGTAGDMATMATCLESLSSNIAEQYATKAGGTADAWRAAMQPESWYKAQEAVDAGLADRLLAKDEAATAPSAKFDLTMFAHAGRSNAPAPPMPAKGSPTPAEPPVTPPTTPKEADAMSDTLLQGLRERFDLADDADEATVLAKADELLDAATAPNPTTPPPPDPTPAPPAAVPAGMTLVSETLLATLQEGAAAGIAARAKQQAEDRDAAVAKAFTEGKISADSRADWTKAWDLRPEQTAKELDSLGVRFPVGPTAGYQGDDGSTGDSAKPFTDDEADALGALAGIRKGVLR